jgi:type I restriction enzyme S subunit
VGKVAPVLDTPHRATLGAFISLLRADEFTDKKFVYYQLTASEYQDLIRSTASTTTNISNVSTQKLVALPFRFPPAPEQRRIVSEIELLLTDLEAAVAGLKRVQANLKRYRASVLKAACEGRLVPTEAELARKDGRSYETGEQLLQRILKERRAKWEADQFAKMHASGKPPKDDDWKRKYKEPAPPDTSGLPELPGGWTWASLAQIAEIQGGIQKQPSRRPKKNVFPFLRVANVYRSRLELGEMHVIELFQGELDKLRLETGDLLIVEGNGSPSEIGRMAIWRDRELRSPEPHYSRSPGGRSGGRVLCCVLEFQGRGGTSVSGF